MNVLYEDSWFLIVYKPPGVPVLPGKESSESLLKSIGGNYTFLEPVHRLDQVTQGVLLMAKTREAQTKTSLLFQTGGVQKTYFAITDKVTNLTKGTWVDYLKRNGRKHMAHIKDNPSPGYKKAQLDFDLCGYSESLSFWVLKLKTGRFHQIRAQLASHGYPIRGDRKYGYKRYNKTPGICLQAYSITFNHPYTHDVVTAAAPPQWDENPWNLFIDSWADFCNNSLDLPREVQ